jgi:hypothetical protein
VVQGFSASLGGGYGDVEVFFDPVLPDEVNQAARAQAGIQDGVVIA